MKRAEWDSWPKSFLYLSPVKIDSLFNQLDQGAVKRLAKKLTINLKVISAEFATQDRPETVQSRLRIVLEHLEQQTLIGSVDEPGPYVSGSMPMRWGPYDDADSRVVFFAGQSNETVLGMGGSIENMFGGVGGPPTSSHSATGALLAALDRDGAPGPPKESDDYGEAGEEWELAATRLAVSGGGGPLQYVEFVAKKLVWGEAGPGYDFGLKPPRTMLASPLYVAQAD